VIAHLKNMIEVPKSKAENYVKKLFPILNAKEKSRQKENVFAKKVNKVNIVKKKLEIVILKRISVDLMEFVLLENVFARIASQEINVKLKLMIHHVKQQIRLKLVENALVLMDSMDQLVTK